MSDAIRQSSAAHAKAMHNLEAKQRREQAQLEKTLDASLEETRRSKEASLVNLRTENQREIAEEATRKEEALIHMRDSLEKTRQVTSAEINRLQNQYTRRREDIVKEKESNLNRTEQEAQLAMETQNSKINNSLRQMNDEHQRRQEDMEYNNHRRENETVEQWKTRIQRQREGFSHAYHMEEAKFDKNLKGQEKEHKHVLLNDHLTHEKRMEEMNKLHTSTQKKTTEQHNKAIQERELFFEKKYAGQFEKHQKIEKDLELRNEALAKESQARLLKKVSAAEARKDDPFFTFSDLKTMLMDTPESYILKLEVPEYAKEEVRLTANPKMLILTHDRRHRDERTEEDGTVKRVDKVESLVQRIPVKSVLDTKKLEKAYADGVLTFTIPKA